MAWAKQYQAMMKRVRDALPTAGREYLEGVAISNYYTRLEAMTLEELRAYVIKLIGPTDG